VSGRGEQLPQVSVVFFQDDDESVPALEWLRDIKQRDRRITAKFHERILELKDHGWELTRPSADILRDGIYELRVRFGSVNYRLLYGFHGRTAAVLAHGVVKETEVPGADVDIAIERMTRFAKNPEVHTYVRPLPQPRRGNRQ
jgi:phage-related protein